MTSEHRGHESESCRVRQQNQMVSSSFVQVAAASHTFFPHSRPGFQILSISL
jgi:hypothetical protein